MITKGFLDKFFMLQFIYAFYSKEITLEQFLMNGFIMIEIHFMFLPYLFKMVVILVSVQ